MSLLPLCSTGSALVCIVAGLRPVVCIVTVPSLRLMGGGHGRGPTGYQVTLITAWGRGWDVGKELLASRILLLGLVFLGSGQKRGGCS